MLFFFNCSLHACLCLAVCACVSYACVCVLFSSVPALLMGCHPGLSRKAASSVGLGINPRIMALMPSWVEAKLFKKYWLLESLSLLFLSPPLSISCLYLSGLAASLSLLSLFFTLFLSVPCFGSFASFSFLSYSLHPATSPHVCNDLSQGLIFANLVSANIIHHTFRNLAWIKNDSSKLWDLMQF